MRRQRKAYLQEQKEDPRAVRDIARTGLRVQAIIKTDLRAVRAVIIKTDPRVRAVTARTDLKVRAVTAKTDPKAQGATTKAGLRGDRAAMVRIEQAAQDRAVVMQVREVIVEIMQIQAVTNPMEAVVIISGNLGR